MEEGMPARPEVLLLLTISALGVAPAAVAQTFQLPSAANVNQAPVSASIEAAVDTNVAGSDAAVAAARGLKLEDEIYTPNVALNLTHQFGREALVLNGDIGYEFYQHNTVLNRESIDLQGGVDGQFGTCKANVLGGVNRHQTYLQDLAVVGPIVSNTQSLSTIKLDGSCGGSIGFGPALSVSQAWQTNSTASFQQFDYRQFMVTGSLVYQRPSFGKLSAFVQYEEADYPNQIVPLPGGASRVGNHYNLYAGGARFERDIGARISATVSGAYTSLEPLQGPGFSGFSYNADLAYRIFGRTQLHLSAGRAAQPALLNNAAFEVVDTYQAEASYAMSSRVNLTLGASDEREHFGGIIGLPLEVTDDQFQEVYSSARLDFARRFYLELDARYEVRHANVVQLNYDSERVGLTLGAHI
jgi:Putative beta-barrel porin 2